MLKVLANFHVLCQKVKYLIKETTTLAICAYVAKLVLSTITIVPMIDV
jgi:hypothetical protein